MTKFKDELRKYPCPPSSAMREHVQRWLDNDGSEVVWQKINQATDLKPDAFISFVLATLGRARGLTATLDFHAEVRQRYRAAHTARIKSALKSKASLSEIANVLEEAADDFRLSDSLLDDRLARLPAKSVSRKDQEGSQARRAFCLTIGEFLNNETGNWMDAEVATLVDIALPQHDATTIDQVRAMRRATTSRARKRRLN